VTAEKLAEALSSAVRPDELVGGELDGSFYRNSTLMKSKAD